MTRIDHVILGVANLDDGIEQFERLTGVRPAYGGRHPTGTHNALVSLGQGIYLEIIALQPGAIRPPEFAALSHVKDLTPVGWAVASTDVEMLRNKLASADLPVTEPVAGSRATPAGGTLRWQTVRLQHGFREAPFFIVWADDGPHPSATNPGGCALSAAPAVSRGVHPGSAVASYDTQQVLSAIENAARTVKHAPELSFSPGPVD